MTNDMAYKVLWVDDDENIIQAYAIKAEDYDLDLCHVNNWKEAEPLLKTNFDDYSAIILDAECKMDTDTPEENSFINKVLFALAKIFGEKQVTIPWYILSAGTMDGFDTAMTIAQFNRTDYDEEWGRMLYSKTSPARNDDSSEKLFENIRRVARNKISNIVLYRYHDVFKYLGEGKLIDKEARSIMLRMLCNLHYPENNPNFEYQGNPLRKVMEHIYRAAYKIGLLPSECFEDGLRLNLLDANRFMSGKNTKHSMLRYGNEASDKDKQNDDTIFPKYMGHMTKAILEFANADSHTCCTNEYTIDDKDLFIGENAKELFFSYVLQLCHVIKFFAHFVEQHNDKEANLRMIKKVCHD